MYLAVPLFGMLNTRTCTPSKQSFPIAVKPSKASRKYISYAGAEATSISRGHKDHW